MVKRYEYKGQMLTIRELVPFSVVGYETLMRRISVNSWDVDDVINKPVDPTKRRSSAPPCKRDINKKKPKAKFQVFARCVGRRNSK